MARRFLVSVLSVAVAAALSAVLCVATRVADARAGAGSIFALAAPVSDAGTLQLISTLDSRSRVLGAIAVDLDRDGDLDVVATTAHEAVVVWLNEGRGRLVRKQTAQPRMSQQPALDDADSGGRTLATLPKSSSAAIAAAIDDFTGAHRPSIFVTAPSSRALARRADVGSGRAPPATSFRP